MNLAEVRIHHGPAPAAADRSTSRKKPARPAPASDGERQQATIKAPVIELLAGSSGHRHEHDRDEAQDDAGQVRRRQPLAEEQRHEDGQPGPDDGHERRADAHAPVRQHAVEGAGTDQPDGAGRQPPGQGLRWRDRLPGQDHERRRAGEADGLRQGDGHEGTERPRDEAGGEVRGAPGHGRQEAEGDPERVQAPATGSVSAGASAGALVAGTPSSAVMSRTVGASRTMTESATAS